MVPDHGVWRSLHPDIADMLGFVPLGGKPTGKCGWKLRVNQEPHQATRKTG